MQLLRRLVWLTVVAAAGIAGCRHLLPVNGPILNSLFGWGIATPSAEAVESRLHAPAGFAVSLYASGLENARFMRFTPAGDLLVSQPRLGRITLIARRADGSIERIRPLVENLHMPHGVDWTDGWLYVAETDALGRIRFDPKTRATSGTFERLVTGIPSSHHWTRTVRVTPDRKLLLSIGSSCNVCEEDDRRRAAIVRYELDGTGEHVFATGLRNSVGFDWQPGTGDLYATDNGRDWLGDDFPPCELNRIVDGGFYGFPVANGNRVPDPDFGKGQEARIAASIPPAHAFHPHNAPLGITFLRGATLPPAYRNAALVALHGSWNRTHKDGYKVVSLHWQPDGAIEERDFLTGFLQGDDVAGRPVDVAEGPDGALYVSDDYASAIYRVTIGAMPVFAPTAYGAPAATPNDSLAAMPAAERAARAARGADAFAHYACAGCHGDQASPPRPIRHLGEKYTLQTLRAYLAAPTPPMPNFNLDDETRTDLAVHLLTTYR